MDKTIAEGIREFARVAASAVHQPPILSGDGAERLVVPEGYKVERIEPVDRKLGVIRQTPAFADVDSFVAYVNRFKAPETVIFGDLDHRTVTAVMDYHAPGADGKPARADYTAHRAIYSAKLAEEWARWAGIDGKLIGQTAFAEFVEENLVDIREPVGAAVLEVASQLRARKKVEFQSGVQLQNGTVQLVYKEDIDAAGKGEMAVPSEIKIGVPIFYGGPKYEVRVFLRYRIEDGKLGFKIDIHRRRYLEHDAFNEFMKGIGEGTSIAPLAGRLA